MNELYNDGFAPEFSVSMSKETIELAQDYVSETKKQNLKPFSNETLNFFFRKF